VGALRIRTGTQTPLFLAHDGYGDELYFSALAQYLPAELPLYGLPAIPLNEPQLHTLAGMAARMVALIQKVQPEGPYRLAGWSFGGVLAYEITQQLLDKGKKVEFLGLIDAFCPELSYVDTYPEKTPEDVLKHLCERAEDPRLRRCTLPDALCAPERDHDFDELFIRYRELKVLPETFEYLSPEQARLRCRYLALHTRAMDNYRPKPLNIPIQLFVAADRNPDFSLVPSQTLGWERCVPEHLLNVRKAPGSHESMLRLPHIAVLGQQLTQALASKACRGIQNHVSFLKDNEYGIAVGT
jgi:arthrofactin-type cyclic lipopeptide synthetase C